MAEPKTKPTDANVTDFILDFAATPQKQQDSFALIGLMREVTGCEPKMWGPSIIGFGSYRYTSAKGTSQGDMPLVGFSPRKAAISLYVFSGAKEHEYMLEGLGKFTLGKACIYVKKLSDINLEQLRKLMVFSINSLREPG